MTAKVTPSQCDEQRPTCSGCEKYSTKCIYPAPNHLQATAETATNDTHLGRSLLALPSPELNFSDLELLHQYLTFTCVATSQLPEVTSHIQTTVPPLAQSHPFVMRGILAMGATHLSRLRPSRQAHYDLLAASNHTKALPNFRSGLRNMNSENCYPLIVYSKSLVWCSMASDPSAASTESAKRSSTTWLPHWFTLLHGSCVVVETSRRLLTTRPPMVQTSDDQLDDIETPDDNQFLTLHAQLLRQNAPVLSQTILLKLREAFVRASLPKQNTPYRNAINSWFGSLPDQYILSLQQKEPWALILLAHFCVLLHRSETVWIMKGHAMRLLLLIDELLSDEWKEMISWPCIEVGISKDTPS